MNRIIAVLLICALCVGLLLYNLFGVNQPENPKDEPTKVTTESKQAPSESQKPSNPDQEPVPESDVKISVMNTNPDCQAAWEQIAADYKKATGVEVEIATDAEQRPTIFTVTSESEVDAAACLDLTDTVACTHLADMGLALTAENKVYGIATEVECFGLIYNKNLLAQVATPEEITNIESFSTVVHTLVDKGYTAFAGRGLNEGVAIRLASIPGSIQSFAKLWAETAAKDGEGTALERFVAGESVFYLGSSDEYDTITAAGIDQLGILPVYQNSDGTTNSEQALCVTTKGYWCVRSDVSQEETAAAKAFLDYLFTSADDGQVPVDKLELLAPYRTATYSANSLELALRESVRNGKSLLVCPAVEAVPEGFVDALMAYAQEPTDENWAIVHKILGR